MSAELTSCPLCDGPVNWCACDSTPVGCHHIVCPKCGHFDLAKDDNPETLEELRAICAERFNRRTPPQAAQGDDDIFAGIDFRPWPKKCERIERIGDMGEGMKLSLFIEDDGDVIVSVIPASHKFGDAQVQFCVPGTGGGQSERTHDALIELARAIEADTQARPQSFSVPATPRAEVCEELARAVLARFVEESPDEDIFPTRLAAAARVKAMQKALTAALAGDGK